MSQTANNIKLFESIANAIAVRYRAEISIRKAELSTRPPFEELLAILTKMEQELTKEGVQFHLKLKNLTPEESKLITNQLKEIIKTTIEQFIKEL